MNSKYCKLIMVTSANNNKYYTMTEKNGLIHIEFGRVDLTKSTLTKPLKEWDSIYKEKVKKGYKDVTYLLQEVKVDSKDSVIKSVSSTTVQQFLNLMETYTSNLVKNTYSVTYRNVTDQQVKKAQAILDSFDKIDKKDVDKVNEKLLELYTIIPRYMAKVQFKLLPAVDLNKKLEEEQSNIDAISAQVSMYNQDTATIQDNSQTLFDILGLTLTEVSEKDIPDVKYIVDQLKSNKRFIEKIFKVEKPEETNIFETWLKSQTNKSTRTLIHGTRCSSVLAILKQGLKIRPSGNFQFSGKSYGDGNYFSEVVNKSLNYTGFTPDKILLVYEVHTGNPYTYHGWYNGNSFTLDYKNLKQRGFDSTYVKAGNGLVNSEIISYREEQCKIKAIIWLK